MTARPVRQRLYDRIDLTGVPAPRAQLLPPGLLRSARGRADMLATAREHGYPAESVTPVVTRWFQFYVVQVAADRDQATVTLALAEGGQATVKLPEVAQRTTSPTHLHGMLTRLRDGYPPQAPAATLTQALIAVLHHCGAANAAGRRMVRVVAIEEAIATELRPHLDLWTGPDQPAT